MKDFLGNELQVGDSVLYYRQGYREMQIAKIVRFTPQMAVLDCHLKQCSHQIVKFNPVTKEVQNATR